MRPRYLQLLCSTASALNSIDCCCTVQSLRDNPELEGCMGQEQAAALHSANGDSMTALQAAFTALMTCPSEQAWLAA